MTGNQGKPRSPDAITARRSVLRLGAEQGPSQYRVQQYGKHSCAAAPKGSSHLHGAEAAKTMEQTPMGTPSPR